MALFWIILALVGLGVVNHLAAMLSLLRFRKDVPVLQSSRDMDHFRATVAHQMYAALVQIAVLGGAPVLTMWGGKIGWLTGTEALTLIPAWLVVLGMGLAGRRLERAVREMPVTEEWRAERDAIGETWRKKPLPDW